MSKIPAFCTGHDDDEIYHISNAAEISKCSKASTFCGKEHQTSKAMHAVRANDIIDFLNTKDEKCLCIPCKNHFQKLCHELKINCIFNMDEFDNEINNVIKKSDKLFEEYEKLHKKYEKESDYEKRDKLNSEMNKLAKKLKEINMYKYNHKFFNNLIENLNNNNDDNYIYLKTHYTSYKTGYVYCFTKQNKRYPKDKHFRQIVICGCKDKNGICEENLYDGEPLEDYQEIANMIDKHIKMEHKQ